MWVSHDTGRCGGCSLLRKFGALDEDVARRYRGASHPTKVTYDCCLVHAVKGGLFDSELLSPHDSHCVDLQRPHFACVCVQSLVENSSIQLLDLSGNQLSVETCLVLTEVMQVRRGCRRCGRVCGDLQPPRGDVPGADAGHAGVEERRQVLKWSGLVCFCLLHRSFLSFVRLLVTGASPPSS